MPRNPPLPPVAPADAMSKIRALVATGPVSDHAVLMQVVEVLQAVCAGRRSRPSKAKTKRPKLTVRRRGA